MWFTLDIWVLYWNAFSHYYMAGEFKMRNSMVNFFAIFNFSRRLYYIVLNDSLLSNPHRKFLNVIINRIIILYMGSVAEWSKALVLGTSLKGRGFESYRCQWFFCQSRYFRLFWGVEIVHYPASNQTPFQAPISIPYPQNYFIILGVGNWNRESAIWLVKDEFQNNEYIEYRPPDY